MITNNPFEVLGLDPGASEEQIVQHAGRLRQLCTDDTMLTAIRQAVQALTVSAEDRQLHALLAHPRPAYEWPTLEKFLGPHRRPPTASPTIGSGPSLDLEEFAALLQALLAEELELIPQPFEPVKAKMEPVELLRQAEEAHWQSLLCDSGA